MTKYETAKKVVEVLRKNKFSTSDVEIFESIEFAKNCFSTFDFTNEQLSNAMSQVSYLELKADIPVSRDGLAYLSLIEEMIKVLVNNTFEMDKWTYLDKADEIHIQEFDNEKDLKDYLVDFFENSLEF